jgi:hypothetical protein
MVLCNSFLHILIWDLNLNFFYKISKKHFNNKGITSDHSKNTYNLHEMKEKKRFLLIELKRA